MPEHSPRAKSRPRKQQSQQLRDYTPQSSFIDITAPDTVDADGYMDAGAYRQELTANAANLIMMSSCLIQVHPAAIRSLHISTQSIRRLRRPSAPATSRGKAHSLPIDS